MTNKKLLIALAGIILIIALCAGSFYAGTYYYETKAAAAALEKEQEQQKLFEPIISSEGMGCELAAASSDGLASGAAISIESADPAAAAKVILDLAARYPGASLTTSSYSYEDSVAYRTNESLYLQGLVPVADMAAFVEAIEQLHGSQIFIVSRNMSSEPAYRAQEICAYDLADIQALELKEAVYLMQLKQGGLDQQAIDGLVQGLEDARADYASIKRSTYLDLQKRLDFAQFNITILTTRG